MLRVFVVLLSFCSFIFAQVGDNEVLYQSGDSTFQVILPSKWSTLELNDVANIQVGNEKDETYFMLLSDPKADLYGWNLLKHSYLTLGNILQGLIDPLIEGPIETEVDGKRAIQFKVEGAIEGLNVIYLHTTVETKKHFNQMVAWSLKSKYAENEDLLMRTVKSFRDLSDSN